MNIEFSKGENPLVAYLRHYCIIRKQGLILAITGGRHLKTGEGKSITAIALAEEIDPTFSVDKIALDATQFIEICNTIEEIGKPAQVMMADEAEVMASNRSYYSIYNKALVDVASTMRNLKCITILCLPKLDMIDKKLQHLIGHWGWVEKVVDEKQNLKVKLRFYRLISNPLGKSELKPERIVMFSQEKGKNVSFDYFEVNLPSKPLMDSYLKLEKEYKRGIRNKILEELEDYERANSKKDKVNIDIVKEEILNDKAKMDRIKSKRGLIDRHALEHYHNLGQKEATILKRELEEMFEQKSKPMVIK